MVALRFFNLRELTFDSRVNGSLYFFAVCARRKRFFRLRFSQNAVHFQCAETFLFPAQITAKPICKIPKKSLVLWVKIDKKTISGLSRHDCHCTFPTHFIG